MPLPDHQVRDPRMRRTRQLLQNGLRTLLAQKPLEEILVQDITDAATVNRATFYDHYTDKFDLFNALIAADFQKLLEQRHVCFDGSCPSGLSAIVLAVGDYLQHLHRDRAACSRQASTGPLVDAAITLAIRRIILEGLEREGAFAPALPREVIASLVSGAIYGAVKEWLSRTKWESDEAALTSLAQLIHPVLEQSTAPARTAVADSPAKRSRTTAKSIK